MLNEKTKDKKTNIGLNESVSPSYCTMKWKLKKLQLLKNCRMTRDVSTNRPMVSLLSIQLKSFRENK